MSTRAIATIVDKAQTQVMRDLQVNTKGSPAANARVLQYHGIDLPPMNWERPPVTDDEYDELQAVNIELAEAFDEAVSAAEEWMRRYQALAARLTARPEHHDEKENHDDDE